MISEQTADGRRDGGKNEGGGNGFQFVRKGGKKDGSHDSSMDGWITISVRPVDVEMHAFNLKFFL